MKPVKKLRADEVLRAVSRKYDRGGKNLFLTEVKTGPTWFAEGLLRFDALVISKSWTKPSITGYEVKVSRGDFLKDEKWPGYLEYCHRFYFVCPSGLISPKEVSEDCGLIWVTENGGTSTRKKAPFRNIEVPVSMFYHLVISHMKDSRHPFFSTEREYLEAYVRDKLDRRQLARAVKTKMVKEAAEIERKYADQDRTVELQEMELQEYRELKKMLNQYGIDQGWRLKKDLEERLKGTIPLEFMKDLMSLRDRLNSMGLDAVSNNNGERR